MKVIIIGGVAASTKVAAKLKRENYDYDVTILTKSKYIFLRWLWSALLHR